MTKYALIYTEDNTFLGTFDTKMDAVWAMTEFVQNHNKELTPFDFSLKEVEEEDTNEKIKDFADAVEYLEKQGVNCFCEKSSECVYENGEISWVFKVKKKDKDLRELILLTNPNNIKYLLALNELLTIAQAWNVADNFKPENVHKSQSKYNVKDLNCLRFKNLKRATQFLKQFESILNTL